MKPPVVLLLVSGAFLRLALGVHLVSDDSGAQSVSIDSRAHLYFTDAASGRVKTFPVDNKSVPMDTRDSAELQTVQTGASFGAKQSMDIFVSRGTGTNYDILLSAADSVYTWGHDNPTATVVWSGQWYAFHSPFAKGVVVRSAVLLSNRQVIIMAIWGSNPGIYRHDLRPHPHLLPPIRIAFSRCPDSLVLSMDERTILWTDVCDGTIRSMYGRSYPYHEAFGPEQVLLKYLVQPKGLAFNRDFTKVFFVANYSVMAADIDLETFDGRPNITDFQVIATKHGVGLVAPVGIAVDTCDDDKVYWSDMCTGKIQRSDFDGGRLEDVIIGLQSPAGMSILCAKTPTTTTPTTTTFFNSTTTNTTTITPTSPTSTNTTTTATTNTSTTNMSSLTTTVTNSTSTSTSNTTSIATTTTNTTSLTTTNTTSYTPSTTNSTTTTTIKSPNTTITTTNTTTSTAGPTATTTNSSTTSNTSTFTTKSTTTNTTSITSTTRTSTNTTSSNSTSITITTTNTTSTITTTTTNTSSSIPTTTTNTSSTKTSSTTNTTTTTSTSTNATTTTVTNTTGTTNTTTTLGTSLTTRTSTNYTSTTVNTTTSTTTATGTTRNTSTTSTPPTTNTTSSTTTVSATTTNWTGSTTSPTTSNTSSSTTTTTVLCRCSLPLFGLADYSAVLTFEERVSAEPKVGSCAATAQSSTSSTNSTTTTSTSSTITATTSTSTVLNCDPPANPDYGEFSLTPGTAGPNAVWILFCGGNRAPADGANTAVCDVETGRVKHELRCTKPDDCVYTSDEVLGYTAGNQVTGTGCGEKMFHGEVCKATCRGNKQSLNTIKCNDGELLDWSVCMEGVTAEPIKKIITGLEMDLSGDVTTDLLEDSLSYALGLLSQWVGQVSFKSIKALFPDRRLSIQEGAHARRLNVSQVISYSVLFAVVVPPHMQESVLLKRVQALPDASSDVSRKFTSRMQVGGVKVSSITMVKPPRLIQSVILRDASGAIIKPRPEAYKSEPYVPPTPPPSNATKSYLTVVDDDTALIIGGVVGGIAGLLFLCGLCFFLFRRPKQELNKAPLDDAEQEETAIPQEPAPQLLALPAPEPPPPLVVEPPAPEIEYTTV